MSPICQVSCKCKPRFGILGLLMWRIVCIFACCNTILTGQGGWVGIFVTRERDTRKMDLSAWGWFTDFLVFLRFPVFGIHHGTVEWWAHDSVSSQSKQWNTTVNVMYRGKKKIIYPLIRLTSTTTGSVRTVLIWLSSIQMVYRIHLAYSIHDQRMLHDAYAAVRAWRLWLDVSWIEVVTGPRLGRQYIDMHSSLFLHLHHATILFDKDKDVLCSSSVCSLLVTVASCVFAYCVCMKLWGRKKTRVVNSLSSLLLQLQRWSSICAFVLSNTYEIFEYIYRSPVSMR